jgi:toxin ParE1/3/4
MVTWTSRARRDLRDLYEYVSEDDPEAARAVSARVLEAGDALVTFPARGRPGRVVGTRELVVGGTPYVLIYRVSGDTVQILRILHGARRWPA